MKIKNILNTLIIFILLIGVYLYTNKDNKVIEIPNSNITINYFNVGEAECFLIENNNHYMLIDSGNNVDGPLLVNYFKKIGISKFDLIIATHPHEDHIGGLDNIINNFKVDKLYMIDINTDFKTFKDLEKAIIKHNVKVEIPEVDSTFKVNDIEGHILYLDDDEEDINDSSIVVRLVFGKTSYLFMSDVSNEVERKIMNKDIRSDVLKIGHHGSTYSSSYNFLKKVKPIYAIISVGQPNDYYHPHEAVLKRLANLGIKYYRTDIDGTITIKSDGEIIEVKTSDLVLDGVEKK